MTQQPPTHPNNTVNPTAPANFTAPLNPTNNLIPYQKTTLIFKQEFEQRKL